MMRIRKVTGIAPDDTTAAERVFTTLEPQAIACCNWAAQYPYAPQAAFRMFHTGERLWLRFEVAERYTAALVTEDNGAAWTDSCVEFFIAVDDESYYNFETTCIGRMLLHNNRPHRERIKADGTTLRSILRRASLGSLPFAEREGDNRWTLTLAIPPQALFRHKVDSWDGLAARMNLYKCGDHLSHPHFLSWKPIATERPDFHRPEFFGEALFEG